MFQRKLGNITQNPHFRYGFMLQFQPLLHLFPHIRTIHKDRIGKIYIFYHIHRQILQPGRKGKAVLLGSFLSNRHDISAQILCFCHHQKLIFLISQVHHLPFFKNIWRTTALKRLSPDGKPSSRHDRKRFPYFKKFASPSSLEHGFNARRGQKPPVPHMHISFYSLFTSCSDERFTELRWKMVPTKRDARTSYR